SVCSGILAFPKANILSQSVESFYCWFSGLAGFNSGFDQPDPLGDHRAYVTCAGYSGYFYLYLLSGEGCSRPEYSLESIVVSAKGPRDPGAFINARTGGDRYGYTGDDR